MSTSPPLIACKFRRISKKFSYILVSLDLSLWTFMAYNFTSISLNHLLTFRFKFISMNSLMACKFKSVSVNFSYGLWVYKYLYELIQPVRLQVSLWTYTDRKFTNIFIGTLMACKFTIISMNLYDMYVYKNLYEHLKRYTNSQV